jgi:hypothetical protein
MMSVEIAQAFGLIRATYDLRTAIEQRHRRRQLATHVTTLRLGHVFQASAPLNPPTGFRWRPHCLNRRYGILSIDDELIAYTGKNATQFNGCQRGAFGTQAAQHAQGATTLMDTEDGDAAGGSILGAPLDGGLPSE